MRCISRLLVAVCLLLAYPASNAWGQSVPQLASQLAEQTARPWPAMQNRDGSFPDYILQALPGQTRDWYGQPTLGSALILHGERTNNQTVLNSGMRAVAYAIDRRSGFSDSKNSPWPAGSPRGYAYPFSMMALIDSWNQVHSALVSNSTWAQLQQNKIIPAIQADAPVVSPSAAERPANQLMLEKLSWQAALATGLKSSQQRSVLTNPEATQSQIDTWLDAQLKKSTSNQSGVGPDGKPNLLLSDYPAYPHAYHGFAAGILARMIYWSPARRKSELMPKLREAVHTIALLASPQGDLAYAGRSTMMPWSLSWAAYAVLTVAGDSSTTPEDSASLRRLARRLLSKLQSDYFAAKGLALMPAMKNSPQDGLAALDLYPCALPYTGLTLLSLEWIARMPDGPEAATDQIQSGSTGKNNLETRLGVLAGDQLWLGVRGQRHAEYDDLRYDLGPMAAQQKVKGVWRWLLPVRPMRASDKLNSWIRIRSGKQALLPTNRSQAVQSGLISQQLAFAGHALLGVAYRQSACGGLAVNIPAWGAGSLETVFWLPGAIRSIDAKHLQVGEIDISSNQDFVLQTSRSPASASHASLSQVVLRFNSGPVSLSLCLRH